MTWNRLLALFLYTSANFFGPYACSQDMDSADKILLNSRQAMAPPIRFVLTSGGVRTVVSQGFTDEGQPAMRIDSSVPAKKHTLQLGSQVCEVYPDAGILIDMSFAIKNAELAEIEATREPVLPDSAFQENSRLVEFIQSDGRRLAIIETPMFDAGKFLLEAGVAAEVVDQIPTLQRSVVNVDSYQLVEVSLLSSDGKLAQKSEYSEIARDPEVSEDFFQVPVGMRRFAPTSFKEYLSLVWGNVLKKSASQDINKEIDEVVRQAEAKAERFMKAAEVEIRNNQEIAEEKKNAIIRDAQKTPMKVVRDTTSGSSGRLWFIVLVNCMALVVFLLFWLVRYALVSKRK